MGNKHKKKKHITRHCIKRCFNNLAAAIKKNNNEFISYEEMVQRLNNLNSNNYNNHIGMLEIAHKHIKKYVEIASKIILPIIADYVKQSEHAIEILAWRCMDANPEHDPDQRFSDLTFAPKWWETFAKNQNMIYMSMKNSSSDNDHLELTKLKSLFKQMSEDYSIIYGEECSICLDSEVLEIFYRLKCGHNFHNSCISAWFKAKGNKACPLCRADPDIIIKL